MSRNRTGIPLLWRGCSFALLLVMAGVVADLTPNRALADEGMWTFDNFPAATVKTRYGVDIDQAWLDHVQGAAVRLSTVVRLRSSRPTA